MKPKLAAMSGEDDFRIRPGRIRSPSAQRARPFIAQALAAAQRAGGSVSRKGTIGPGHRSRFGHGQRASVQANRLITSRSRGAVVKARVVRHGGHNAPLGTHLYVAMEAEEDGKSMRWLTVSVGPSQPQAERRQTGRRGDRAEAQPALPRARPTAGGVLDRFEMPEETRKLISDKLWAGASLTVSDEGVSHETGKYTDFIVLTR